jgi:dipeptidyl aminopeptidase/acylaminoacyl peptidase
LSHLKTLFGLLLVLMPAQGLAQPPERESGDRKDVSLEALMKELEALKEAQQNERHTHDRLQKLIDDALWHLKLQDLAQVDKVSFTGPAPRYQPNPTAQGAGNPMVVYAYTFIPRKLDRSAKQPLLVLVHSGVHSNLNTSLDYNVVRELLEQGYTIVAPEYRGSTGYGRSFYDAIDYGATEIEDTFSARNWMLDSHEYLDGKRVGILGWSHGGLHTLMNIFEHPDAYQAAYAGVPVSDLVARMGYKTEGYRQLFAAKSHIGKSAFEDVNEYRKRSPAWNAHKLETPLLIHTNTNDEDVNVLEVEHLIKSLKAEGKKFEYKIYEDAPGGHKFNQLDTQLARESRREVYRFLARYLSPPNPPK